MGYFSLGNESVTYPPSIEPLSGLLWACLGDSQTSNASISYYKHVADRTGISPLNYGVAGSKVVPNGTNGFLDRYEAMDDNADIVTIQIAGNDAAANTPLGEPGNRDTATFYGALNVLFEEVSIKYDGKPVGVIGSWSRTAYAAYVKERAEFYSLPYLDLDKEGNMSYEIQYMRDKYTTDGIHLNDAGHQIISRRIESFLRRLIGKGI